MTTSSILALDIIRTEGLEALKEKHGINFRHSHKNVSKISLNYDMIASKTDSP